MHMRFSYRPVNGKTALLNKRTRTITFQRRYQTKEREQLLFNGVTKQKNASNYFSTALPSKRTRTITFQRRYQAKEREQLLFNGVTKQKNANNYFWTALPNKRTRTITFQRRYQAKERVQLLSNGVFSSFIGSNPILPVRYGTIRRPTRAV